MGMSAAQKVLSRTEMRVTALTVLAFISQPPPTNGAESKINRNTDLYLIAI
jgi:hypothetical protein